MSPSESAPSELARIPLRGAIDVHAHYLTATYRQGLADAGITEPDGFPHVPQWSPEEAIESMDRLGIVTSMLSVSSPGVFFGDLTAARLLARAINEEGAEIVRGDRDRFGLIACLPLPDVDAALEELARCYEELDVDGVGLLTNYQGCYLGDDGHEELFAELNRRRATVLLHPTSPPGWEALALGRPRPMIEFPLDTARTVLRLVLNGVPQRHPGIRFVIPHAGIAIPSLVDRVSMFSAMVDSGVDEPPIDVGSVLGRFYYDLAGAALPRALPALLGLVEPDRLLYGSDQPFTPPAQIMGMGERLIATDLLSQEGRRAMLCENALRLFPAALNATSNTTDESRPR